VEFLKNQYRHCKTILLMGSASMLLDKAGIPSALPTGDPDPGLLAHEAADTESAVQAFVTALMRHRHFERETDPPLI
jgi:catalase